MRTAVKRGLMKSAAQRIVQTTIRRRFAGIHVSHNFLDLAQIEAPVLYVANHVSLWDYAIGGYLCYQWLQQDPFCMTIELMMLPFAEYVGAFSVNPSDAFNVSKSIQYSIDILKTTPKCAFWIFPQGAVWPINKRPLDFKNGVWHILQQVNNAIVVPVTFLYTFTVHTKPEAFIYFGNPRSLHEQQKPTETTKALETCITQQIDYMEGRFSQSNTDDFTTILHGNHDARYFALRATNRPYPPLKKWGRWYKQ